MQGNYKFFVVEICSIETIVFLSSCQFDYIRPSSQEISWNVSVTCELLMYCIH